MLITSHSVSNFSLISLCCTIKLDGRKIKSIIIFCYFTNLKLYIFFYYLCIPSIFLCPCNSLAIISLSLDKMPPPQILWKSQGFFAKFLYLYNMYKVKKHIVIHIEMYDTQKRGGKYIEFVRTGIFLFDEESRYENCSR